jgi:hypothetical protein
VTEAAKSNSWLARAAAGYATNVAVYVWTNSDSQGWTWTLCRTLPHGADVVLHGCVHHETAASCRLEGTTIAGALSQATVEQNPDGTWSWCCHDVDGRLVAKSAAFPDAVTCGDDLSRARMLGQHAVLAPHDDRDDAEAQMI